MNANTPKYFKTFVISTIVLVLSLWATTVSAADLTVGNNGNRTINGTETYDNATINGTLNVNGNLYINGNITMGNNGVLNISPGAVVVIYGDADLGNQVHLDVSSFFIVIGNLTKGGSTNQGTLDSNDAKIYVFGDVNGFGTTLEKCDGDYEGHTESSDPPDQCEAGGYSDFLNLVDSDDLPPGVYDEITNSYEQYCIPEPYTSNGYITNVVFGDISNSTGQSRYSDYTNQSTTLKPGQSYTIYVTVRSTTNNRRYVRVWIDWNWDFSFDLSEQYELGNSRFSGTHTFSATITVPQTAINGKTRLRVGEKYNANVDPCEINFYGEVEDYSVNIFDLSIYDGIAVDASATSVCSGSEVSMSVDVPDNDCLTYSWQSSTDGTNWTDVSSSFFESDFSSLPPLSSVYDAASVSGGELILTPAQNSRYGGFVISDTPGTDKNYISVSFDYRIWDGSGADGFSLSYASDINDDRGAGEEGEGSGLRICFDTYDNTDGHGTSSQIYIYYNNTRIWNNNHGEFDLRNSNYRQVDILVNESGELLLSIGGVDIVNKLSLPGYTSTDKSDWRLKFAARTGALNDKHTIDNLVVRYNEESSLITSVSQTTYYRVVMSCGAESVVSDPVQISSSSIQTNPLSMP